jgi:hypothetical protein
MAVLLLLAGALFADIKYERAAFTSGLTLEHKAEHRQRMGKLNVETKLTEASAVLDAQSQHMLSDESDLKLMGRHIEFIQNKDTKNILAIVDKAAIQKWDHSKTKNELRSAIEHMNKKVSNTVADEVAKLHKAATLSSKRVKRMQQEITEELAEQEEMDQEGNDYETNKELLERQAQKKEDYLSAIFNHVYQLAEKLGDTDIDNLLDKKNVREWGQVLEDTESGQ